MDEEKVEILVRNELNAENSVENTADSEVEVKNEWVLFVVFFGKLIPIKTQNV